MLKQTSLLKMIVSSSFWMQYCAMKWLRQHPASLEAFLQQKYSKDPALTIDQYRATIVQAIGENIQIRRLDSDSKTSSNKSIGVYSHLRR